MLPHGLLNPDLQSMLAKKRSLAICSLLLLLVLVKGIPLCSNAGRSAELQGYECYQQHQCKGGGDCHRLHRVPQHADIMS